MSLFFPFAWAPLAASSTTTTTTTTPPTTASSPTEPRGSWQQVQAYALPRFDRLYTQEAGGLQTFTKATPPSAASWLSKGASAGATFTKVAAAPASSPWVQLKPVNVLGTGTNVDFALELQDDKPRFELRDAYPSLLTDATLERP